MSLQFTISRKGLFLGMLCSSGLLAICFVSAWFGPRAFKLALYAVVALLALTAALWILKFAFDWLSRQDLFSPLIAYPLMYVGWFVIGSIDFIHLPSSISFGAFDPIPARVWLYASIGLVGYLCGTKSSMSPSKIWKLNRVSDFRFTWELRVFRFVVVVMLLAAASTYLYVAFQTGIIALRPDAGSSVYELEKYHRAMTPFFFTAYSGFLFLTVSVFINPARGGTKSKLGPIFVIAIILLSLIGLGGRSFFFAPVLTAVILYHYVGKPFHLKTVIAIVLVLFVFLSVYAYVRSLTVGGDFTAQLTEAGMPPPVQPLLYNYLYFRYTAATFRDVTEVIPRQVPFQHGTITFMPFLSLLPGHHRMSDYFFKDLLGNEFLGAGQPATVLGPFYADFGTAGIFGGMFAWGLLATKLYRWMLTDRTAFSALIYAWTMQAGLFGLYGGMFVYISTLLIPLSWVLLNILLAQRSNGLDVLGHSSAEAGFIRGGTAVITGDDADNM